MPVFRAQLLRDAASRGKYASLYRHLCSRPGTRWRASFSEVEEILGFELPKSARVHRPWWANQKRDAGHSHALSWQAAGWKTQEVDLETELLVFARETAMPTGGAQLDDRKTVDFDTFWPTISGGDWPRNFTVGRGQIYDESGRLTGGPQSDNGNGNRGQDVS